MTDSDLWLQGPAWLSHTLIISEVSDSTDVGIDEKTADESLTLVVANREILHCFKFERWGSYNKMISIICYVVRFIQNTRLDKSSRSYGELTCEEWGKATEHLYRILQQTTYPDEICCLSQSTSLSNKSPLSINYEHSRGTVKSQGTITVL